VARCRLEEPLLGERSPGRRPRGRAGNRAVCLTLSFLIGLAVLWGGSVEALASCNLCTGTGSIDLNDGNTDFENGSTLQAGFAISIPGAHPATTVSLDGTATFHYWCSGVPGMLTIHLAGTYTIPANDGNWYPSGNQSAPASYQGSAVLASCGPNGVSIGYPGSTETFAFTLSADQSVTVNVRWHYRGTRKSNGRLTAGDWSTTLPVQLACSPCAPRVDVAKVANVTTARVGDVIIYTYTVTNTGNVRLTGVGVSDNRLGAIGLGTTTLSPSQSTTGTAQYIVAESDPPGPLENVATATGTPPSGAAVTDTSAPVSVTLLQVLSLQILSGASVGFPAIVGPGQYLAQGGTTLRVTSDRAGWTLGHALSFSLPQWADMATVERVFQVTYGTYTPSSGTTNVQVSYSLSVAAADFAGLPQGEYLITVTYTVTSGS